MACEMPKNPITDAVSQKPVRKGKFRASHIRCHSYIRRQLQQQQQQQQQQTSSPRSRCAASVQERRPCIYLPLPSQEATMSLVPGYWEEMMDFSSKNEIQFYEAQQSFEAKAFPGLRLCACDLQTGSAFEVGIQVKLTEQSSARNFRKVVVIVVAIEKMKKKHPQTALFNDDDLMDILSTVLDPVAFDTCESTFAANSICRFLRSISYSGIHDTDNKYLALNESAQLVASHLQGANMNHAVKLEMALYIPKNPGSMTQGPIALRLNGKNELCLACVQHGGKPMLRLEEADIMKDLDRSQLGRFLFHKINVDDHYTRFESATFPGWFICTATKSDQAVEMTDQLGGASITQYVLQKADEMGLD